MPGTRPSLKATWIWLKVKRTAGLLLLLSCGACTAPTQDTVLSSPSLPRSRPLELPESWDTLSLHRFETWVEDFPQETGVPPDNVPQRIASSITDGALAAFGLRDSVPGAGPGKTVFDEQTPWLLYLHYMDPHGLYDAPGEAHFATKEVDPIPENNGHSLAVMTAFFADGFESGDLSGWSHAES